MGYSALNIRKIQNNIKRKQETIIKNSKKMLSAPKYIQVGWTSKSGTYPETGVKVMDVARIHEFGLGNQTEKAFVRITSADNGTKWKKMFEKEVKGYLKKKKTLTNQDKTAILQKVGEQIKIDLQGTITDIDLVDTTRLKNSILITFKRR